MPLKPGTVWFTILLGMLLGFTPLGTDSFLPMMPAVARGYGAPASAVQLAVTTFLLGVAAGQLAWGPVSDRYGRRRTLLAGLALFLAAALWCATARSVGALVWGRLLQGLGMSSGPVVARSMVRDLYEREQAGRLLARMMVVFGAVPIALAWTGVTHWAAVVAPMIVYMYASSYVLPHATAAALSPFPRVAGSASSLLGAFQFCVGAAVSAGLGAAFEGTARPMASLTAVAGTRALVACGLFMRDPGAPRGNR